jgi:hypothetical protein
MRSIVLVLVLAPWCSFAQEGAPGLLSNAYLSYGSGRLDLGATSVDDWRTILPNSALMQRDIPAGEGNGFFDNGYYYGPGVLGVFDGATSGAAYVGVGLKFGRKRLDTPSIENRVRIGLTYSGYESAFVSWGRSTTARYDTLVSQSTGQLFFRDTTYSERYSVGTSWSRIGLDLSQVLRRVSRSRWSWSLGYGTQVGAIFNTEAVVNYEITRTNLSYSGPNSYRNGSATAERWRLNSTFWGSVYALAGLDFRLGKEGRFLQDLLLFYELRPMLLTSALPGMSAQLNGSVQQLIGIRFDLDRAQAADQR